MVFRSLYWRIGFRVLLLTGALLLLCICLINGLYLRSVYLIVLVVMLIVELFYFLTRFTENIKTFLVAVQQRDFTIHFDERQDSFRSLYAEFNKVTNTFKQISSEKEIQHQFLEMLVEHIRIGIICFDAEENIYLVNNAFRDLTEKRSHSKFSLTTLDPSFLAELRHIKSGESQSVRQAFQHSTKTFALYASDFKLQSARYKLISVQDITPQLNAKEIESYMKLMRVLTHEIMNSIAPIVSLSETMHGMVQKQVPESSPEVLHSLEEGLDAIRVRSKGLKQFTETYRQLSRIPNPTFSLIDIQDFVRQLMVLVSHQLKEKNVRLEVKVEQASLSIDATMLEQAVINLIRNAAEALANKPDPILEISGKRKDGKYVLAISDNGLGIPQENMDKIFVPFFTTKENGTGIGLALVRQIIQLHGGEISVVSLPNERTTFTIHL